jgi:SAM-dependent methyltransferase
MSDWGLGAYERIADDLAPAAEALVEAAGVGPGDLVLDVGCGSGAAVLAAARRGATVRGVDPSERLIHVACAAAAAEHLAAEFAVGDAANLPVEDRSADVVISSFGLVFAENAWAAVDEAVRVSRGRIAFTAWKPGGPLAEVAALRRLGSDPVADAPMFAWHDEAELTRLFARHGYSVEVEERELAFAAESATAFVEREVAHHPMWVAARRALRSARAFRALTAEAAAVLAEANELAGAFRVTSPYMIVRCSS